MNKLAIAPTQHNLYASQPKQEALLLDIKVSEQLPFPARMSMQNEIMRLNGIAAKPPFCTVRKTRKFDPL